MKVLVGSSALKIHGLCPRENVDIDIWTDEDLPLLANHDISKMPTDILEMIPTNNEVASIDALYTIKLSHMAWDIFWEKHKRDLLVLKLKAKAKLIPDLYFELIEHWKTIHGNKDFLSLYKDKTAFFTDSVTYVYDHDYLHELVAYPDVPVYTYCLKDGCEVAIDKSKFDMLPFRLQVRMFREEISVIAAERWLIPPKVCGKVTWQDAYRYALRKTVTSLTKGWATDFILQNIEYFIKPDFSYFNYLFKSIPEGGIIMAKELSVEESKAIMDKIVEVAKKATWTNYKGEVRNYYSSDPDFNELVNEDFSKIPEVEVLKQDGGGEGGAESCHIIFKFEDVIYKYYYSYYSYNGYEFDCDTLWVMEAKEKLVTVYE